MRKRTFVLVGSVLLLTLSSGSKSVKHFEGTNPGDLAPRIESLGNQRQISFQNHSGRYTLLNFWAAYDAESRARNVQLTNKTSELGSDKIVLYSFSLDEKDSVFEETVKADALDTATQFHEELGERSVLYKKFHRKGGFSNFLINSEGLIVASNVTPEKLTELLQKN